MITIEEIKSLLALAKEQEKVCSVSMRTLRNSIADFKTMVVL